MDMETGCGGHIYILPEGCISHVISLTSPLDACRASAVSTTFRSAASSDTVWESFLPSDYESILSRAVHPVEYSSKKELVQRLCDPILIDDGKMSFSLEKSSGAKSYMLYARQLSIFWNGTPHYWSWFSQPYSRSLYRTRFSEDVCSLNIRGEIESRVLTPKTVYAAYLIFKGAWCSQRLLPLIIHHEEYLCSFHFGPKVQKEHLRQEISVRLGAQVSKHTANKEREDAWRLGFWCGNRNQNAVRTPQARADGWMEMKLGEFYNDEGDNGKVEMRFMEERGRNWESRFIIQGIEIRSK